MINIKIDNTDIILQDFDKEGQGKIIIADTWHGAYTYSWCSMGNNISDFICRINSSYFADKLIPGSCYVFSGKITAKNIRRFIRTELSYDLPWYKFMSAQKELREKLKEIESMTSENEFVDYCFRLHKDLMCYDLSFKEENEFLGIIESIFSCEPWHFVGQETSNSYKWLCKLHSELVKKLNKTKLN